MLTTITKLSADHANIEGPERIADQATTRTQNELPLGKIPKKRLSFSSKKQRYRRGGLSGPHFKRIKGRWLYCPPKKKLGHIYIKCTEGNVFCNLQDGVTGKVITSCSLMVPSYENPYNQRDNLYIRGLLLGNLMSKKITKKKYNLILIMISGKSKARRGVVRGLLYGRRYSKKGILLWTNPPHNGCRPSKVRHKKIRTRVRGNFRHKTVRVLEEKGLFNFSNVCQVPNSRPS
uniref:Ribosomal protein S11 n=1 Tax=Phaeophyceae sp. TaxID=2249243 RepID=A0A8E8U504_9PHAE|nr:ribosomal protein S11 [Phaeophyceae sp.]